MPTFTNDELTALCARLLSAGGLPDDEATHIARSLVVSNLMGHDSHGVLRLAPYLDALAAGSFLPGRKIRVVREAPASAVVDGQWGFG